MIRDFPRSLAAKLNLAAATLILVTALGITLFVVRQRQDGARQELLGQGRSIATMLAQNSQYAIYTENAALFDQLTESVRAASDIAYIQILGPDGRVLASRRLKPGLPVPAVTGLQPAVQTASSPLTREFRGAGKGAPYFDLVAPVVAHQSDDPSMALAASGSPAGRATILGYIQLGVSQESVRADIRRFLLSTVLFTSAAVLMGAVVMLVLTRHITAPVKALARVARAVSEGRLDGHQIPLQGGDEVAGLACAFNDMLERLRTYRAQDEAHRQTLEQEVESRTRDLHQIAEEARSLARKADEANRAKSQFLANMSHEIRTPMNGVLGMTELLLGAELSPHQRRLAETVQRSGEALLHIINDILDFSKIEAGKVELDHLDFDVGEAVEEVAELLAPRAHSKGLELACFVHRDIPSLVRGDPTRLQQILNNLAGNAIKFTERGEVVISVAPLQTGADGVVLRFEIRDTGIGMAAEVQERIFDLFAQGDSSTTRRYGGTGLGLTIAKQLVELMGGAISVDSTQGRGSTFWFTARFAPPMMSSADRISRGPVLDEVRVLIVDDNATNRSILHHQVEAWGMRDTVAASGQEALEALRAAAARSEPYALVLLDMHMPDMDGIALVRAIRADGRIAAVRLIMLSSAGPESNAEEARRAGIEEHLTKPVRQSTLYNCLVGLLGAPGRTRATCPAPAHAPSTNLSELHARVLLAEDNPVNQEVAVEMLKSLSCDVDVVTNGRDAVAAVTRARYDLVLMDCQMPELDGFAATTAIRGLESVGAGAASTSAGVHLPIVALTAHALTGDREQCLAAGMDDYLSKPFAREQLRAILERWLSPPAEGDAAPSASTTSSSNVTSRDAAPQPSPPGHAPLDAAAVAALRALQRPGQPDVVGRVMRAYLGSAPPLLEALRIAVTQGDAAATHQAVHSLRSSSANIGALHLASLCREMESAARTRALDGAGRMLPAIEAAYEEARAAATSLIPEPLDVAP